MIELIDVSKEYDGRSIIRCSNYVLPNHGIYCLDGENGSGKSTILGVIAGAVLPDSGAVHIDGRQRRISDRSIKKEIAYVRTHVRFIPSSQAMNFWLWCNPPGILPP